jgi:hypothetical protein
MYLQNKYTKWYYNIIQNAQARILPLNVYFEKHHIVPRSLGGNNKQSNIAKLTPKEHFICHLLLTKMTNGNGMYKMRYALWMLTNIKKIGKGRYTPTGRIYEYVRKCHNDAIKLSWTDEKRKQHSKKLKEFNARVDKTSEQYQNRVEKIIEFQKTKVWTEKAIQSRLENCLENAKNRKGSTWSNTHRQSRLTSYLEKNIDTAEKVFKLHDTGLNNLQISKKLEISWDKVKYSLQHRTDFEAYKLTH